MDATRFLRMHTQLSRMFEFREAAQHCLGGRLEEVTRSPQKEGYQVWQPLTVCFLGVDQHRQHFKRCQQRLSTSRPRFRSSLHLRVWLVFVLGTSSSWCTISARARTCRVSLCSRRHSSACGGVHLASSCCARYTSACGCAPHARACSLHQRLRSSRGCSTGIEYIAPALADEAVPALVVESTTPTPSMCVAPARLGEHIAFATAVSAAQPPVTETVSSTFRRANACDRQHCASPGSPRYICTFGREPLRLFLLCTLHQSVRVCSVVGCIRLVRHIGSCESEVRGVISCEEPVVSQSLRSTSRPSSENPQHTIRSEMITDSTGCSLNVFFE